MLKADVLAYFDDNQSELARECGATRASVNAWGPVIPYWAAKLLASRHRPLRQKFAETMYDERLEPLPLSAPPKNSHHSAA